MDAQLAKKAGPLYRPRNPRQKVVLLVSAVFLSRFGSSLFHFGVSGLARA